MTRARKRRRKGPYQHRDYGPRQGKELLEISEVLDQHPELEAAVAADLEGSPKVERRMTPEQVLRALILMEINRWSSDELEYPLADRRSYRQFSRTDSMFPDYYRATTLQAHFDHVSAATLEALHEVLTARHG